MKIRDFDELPIATDGKVLVGASGTICTTDSDLSDIIGDLIVSATSGKVDKSTYAEDKAAIEQDIVDIGTALDTKLDTTAFNAAISVIDENLESLGGDLDGLDDKIDAVSGIVASDYALSADVSTALTGKEDKVFVAEYNVTPYDDIKAAYDAGKQIVCKYQVNLDQLAYAPLSQFIDVVNTFVFINTLVAQNIQIVCKKQEEQTVWEEPVFKHFYDTSDTSGSQQLTDAFNAKQDAATLMNNINIDVGQNNLALNKENAEIQNIHWSTKNWADETIEQDIVISDMPFAWYGYSDTQGQVQTNTIKLTFAHNLDYYESIILSIDVNGNPIARADVDITHVVVNDTIANWYNTVYIRVKELGDNYIVIGQDGQGPTGYIYNLTTTPELISKIIISTNDFSCISNGHSFVGGINSSALNDCNMAFGDNAIASGIGSVAIGEHTLAIGNNARSIGRYSKASGFGSFAEGCQTSAFGEDSHAEGYETVTNSYNNNGGEGAHAEGWKTSAINHAHSEGYLAIASANESRGVPHAEGYKTSAFIAVTYPFAAAHAEGNCTIASGLDSHAEGYQTSALNYSTHAEGYQTCASGQYSHAEGYGTLASGNYTHTEGYNTIAVTDYMHVGGKYNYTSAGALFVIGNGTGNTPSTRSDAFIINNNGLASATKLATSGIPDVEVKITNIETEIGNIETILQSI